MGELLARARGEARAAAAAFLDALYPARCGLCGLAAAEGPWCAEHRLPLGLEGPRCGSCAVALPPALAGAERCAACVRDPPHLGRVIALGDWRAQEGLRAWVLAFKHGGRRDLARPLGWALARAWRKALEPEPVPDGALLVPVPLHRWRRVERGYDQALLLAAALAEASGARVVSALARVRPTAVQGGAGARSRAANVREAFAPAGWARRRAARVLDGRDAWLVDDVLTSGATARECARLLRRLGARPLGVLALARAGAGPQGGHDRAFIGDWVPPS